MGDETQPVVLVVEDEEDVAETYELWLADEYDVRSARDGDEALSNLDADVDVVLLDRMMPGLSGDDVLARIREQDLGCRVAMVTAVEPDFDILEMGFDAYLSKPVTSEDLYDTVEKLLERSSYDSLLQDYYALVETQATLESSKTGAELAASEEYERLNDRIEDMKTQLTETLGEVEDDDFIATVRRLSDSN